MARCNQQLFMMNRMRSDSRCVHYHDLDFVCFICPCKQHLQRTAEGRSSYNVAHRPALSRSHCLSHTSVDRLQYLPTSRGVFSAPTVTSSFIIIPGRSHRSPLPSLALLSTDTRPGRVESLPEVTDLPRSPPDILLSACGDLDVDPDVDLDRRNRTKLLFGDLKSADPRRFPLPMLFR